MFWPNVSLTLYVLDWVGMEDIHVTDFWNLENVAPSLFPASLHFRVSRYVKMSNIIECRKSYRKIIITLNCIKHIAT